MGFVGGLFGVNGGINGTGISGPSLAGMQAPATNEQANTQYQNVQDAIQQQKDFVAAVQAQKGLQNQSNVFNQFGDIAAGRGPNPAVAMLNRATGRAAQQQAALQAGQRGSSANAGLIARQAAQTGAGMQMDAASQTAGLQAQQSLNALGQQAGIAGQQVGQQAAATGALTNATQNEQANILNAINAQNNANISRQANVNNANAQLAGITMQGQQNMFGSLLNQGMGGLSSMMAEGGEVDNADSPEIKESAPATAPEQTDNVQSSGGVNPGSGPNIGSANIPTIANAFQQQGGSGGGGLKSLMSLVAMADGGQVSVNPGTGADIGSVNIPTIANPFKADKDQQTTGQGAMSAIGKYIQNSRGTGASTTGGGSSGPRVMTNKIYAEGGKVDNKVPALVSPGEVYLDKKAVKEVKKGRDPIKVGEKIPGKPPFPGNDYRNDIVRKDLENGGLVIPNEELQKPNPHWHAMRFVYNTLKKSKNGKR